MQRIFLCLIFATSCNASFSIQNFHKECGNTVLISRETTQYLYQLMKDVHDLLSHYNIPYWILSGTLLGAVRHKGLMLWDDDCDIGVDILYRDKLITLFPLLDKLNYWTTFNPNNSLQIQVGNDYCFLDIFLSEHKDGKIFTKDSLNRGEEATFLYEDELYPLKFYTFGSLKLYGPANPKPYLSHSFGNNYHAEVMIYNHSMFKTGYTASKLIPFDTLPKKFKNCAVNSYPLEDRVKLLLTPNRK